MEIFIKNMITIRKDRHLTQADLAELLGTQQPAISRIERGLEDITMSRAEAFAKKLGFTLTEMLTELEFSEIT